MVHDSSTRSSGRRSTTRAAAGLAVAVLGTSALAGCNANADQDGSRGGLAPAKGGGAHHADKPAVSQAR